MKKSTAGGSHRFSMRQAFFETDPISRPIYFPGKLLSVDDFRAEQNYHREKQRLHNRHCHGAGVVQGLNVSTAQKNSAWTVTIGPGVAIDRETMTQADIDAGVVNVIIGFAPLKPAEFVVIKIQQLLGPPDP